MAFSAASVAPRLIAPLSQREQTSEAGGAPKLREVGEDPGAPLAAVRPLGGWWHSPASATARFVPSEVLHAKRYTMHAPSAGRRPPCKQLIKTRQKCRWDAPCTRRDSWREAVQAAGVQMSRATAYRRRPRMLEGGEAAVYDRRQGHAVNVCGAVLTWLEGYYQHHPHASGKAVQALLEERCGVRVRVTHLNRVRAALTRATRRGKNQPGAWQDGAGGLLLLAAAAGSNLLPTLEAALPIQEDVTPPCRLARATSRTRRQSLLTLLFLGVVGLRRPWDLRGYAQEGLALLTTRRRAYGYRAVLPRSMVDNSVISPNRLTTPIDPAYPSFT